LTTKNTWITQRVIYLIDWTTENTWISHRVIYLIDLTTENTWISHWVIYLIDWTTENTQISQRVIYLIDLTTENIQISQRVIQWKIGQRRKHKSAKAGWRTATNSSSEPHSPYFLIQATSKCSSLEKSLSVMNSKVRTFALWILGSTYI